MVRVRRFGVIRTSNLAAVVYLILSAIFVIPFALVLLANPEFTISTPQGVQTGRLNGGAVGIVFLIVVPILYALAGWVITAITCLIYNLAARITGGIEVEVDRREPPAAVTATAGWEPR